MKTYQLVLWDFDGTLADTLSIALDVYNQLAESSGFLPITDPHAVREMSMREFLTAYRIPTYRVPFAFAAFRKRLQQQAEHVTLHTGIAELLPKIAERGVRQGVVSSNSTENIQQCLTANAAASYFDYVSGTSRIFGKERRIRKAIRRLKLTPDNVLYVGDEIRDIDAARSAGLDIASVTWGLNSAAALESHCPNYVVDTPDQLLCIIT